MALTRWGFVYTVGPDDPIRRDDIGSEGCRLIAVGVPSTDVATRACTELSDDGCELIELCGAFGAAEVAEVERALADRAVPVGVVFYGVTATAGLHRLFVAPDTATAT